MLWAVPSERTHLAGGLFVLAGVLFQILWLGPPAILVSVGLLISYGLWLGGCWSFSPRLKVVFFIGVFIFLVHAAEEFLTGLHRTLPVLLGRAAWSDGRFLFFNGAWAVVFLTAAMTVSSARPLPVLIILFFAVTGGVGNGVAHLLLVWQRGGYFPGGGTAPLCLVMGIWLLRLLYAPGLPSIPTTRREGAERRTIGRRDHGGRE